MENISDSHRVVTDTSDTKPESGRSIIDKSRTFLRRAGESLEKAGQSMKEVNMTHYGKSLKDVDTSQQQKTLLRNVKKRTSFFNSRHDTFYIVLRMTMVDTK